MTGVAFDRMVPLPGGRFRMGSDRFYEEEAPAHDAVVAPFEIDVGPVTNARFAAFVDATGYLTTAERPVPAGRYPGVSPELLHPAAGVFRPPEGPVDLDEPSWWRLVRGASWRAPAGPGSDLAGREDHPVVQVSFEDAVRFAEWEGKRLPSEAEWEYAARGGLDGADYAWGDEPRPDGRVPAAVWQGDFPTLPADQTWGTVPIGSFPANGFGLLDMVGNVWEWTTDRYTVGHRTGCCAGGGSDPLAPSARVLKGGSFLCADNYCHRYRPSARIPQTEDGATANVGFRCVRDPN